MHDTWIFLAVACCFLVILLSTCSAHAGELLEVHGPEGQRFKINPAFITTLREPIAQDRKYFPRGARCVVVMVSGKFIATRETCDQVAKMLPR